MKQLVIAAAMTCLVCACGQKTNESENPFLAEFQTPYGTPDFSRIKVEHYEPAFLAGIDQQNEEIRTIVENADDQLLRIQLSRLTRVGRFLIVSAVCFLP